MHRIFDWQMNSPFDIGGQFPYLINLIELVSSQCHPKMYDRFHLNVGGHIRHGQRVQFEFVIVLSIEAEV